MLTLSDKGGVLTHLERGADGQHWVAKSCRQPDSPGWRHLLQLVRTLRSLTAFCWHPEAPRDGLVGLHSWEQGPQELSVRLAFVTGQNLRQRAGSQLEMAGWLIRLLKILVPLHQLGQIHGDLKPEHLLLSKEGHLVVIDPGYLHADPAQSRVTPEYATEISGTQADLFAVGRMWQELCPTQSPWLAERLPQYNNAEEMLADLERGSPQPRPLAAYVARPAEEAEWKRWLLGPVQGEATWTALGAPSGFGKSRFLQEFSARSCYRVLWGGFFPGQASSSYGALHQALSQLRPQDLPADRSGQAWHQLATVFPSLLTLLEEPEIEGGGLAGPGYSQVVAGLLADLLEAASSPSRPLWLVLDDLQWADEDSLRILQQLSSLRRGHWMVTLAYRSDEWKPDPQLRLDAHMTLPGLTQEQAQQLGALLTVPPERVSAAHDWAAGSPFFLLEALRADGEMEMSSLRHPEKWLSRRLQGLAREDLQFLLALAVQGRNFELAPLSGHEVEKHLPLARKLQIVWSDGSRGTFVHDRFREALLQLARAEQLQALHARLARHWRRPHRSAAFCTRRAQRLAFHLSQGPHPRRALPYLVRLAESAERDQHHAQAFLWLQQAVALHSDLELEIRLHYAEKAIDKVAQAQARLARLHAQHPDQRSLIGTLQGLAHLDQGAYQQAHGAFEKAWRELPVPSSPWQLLLLLRRWNRPQQDPPNPLLQRCYREVSACLPQNAFMMQTARLVPALPYFWEQARFRKDDFLPALGLFCSLMYHAGVPLFLNRRAARLVLAQLKSDTPSLAQGQVRGSVNTMRLWRPDEQGLASSRFAFERISAHRSNWEIAIALFVYASYLLAAGRIPELARLSSTQWANPLCGASLLSRWVVTYYYVLSHGGWPEGSPDPSLVEGEIGSQDILSLTRRALVAAQIALAKGEFDWGLAFFRELPARIFSLDECLLTAWHATLARSAAEALPRRSGSRRAELLREARAQVNRCLRRSWRFLHYHHQALREQALLDVLEGHDQKGRQALAQLAQRARKEGMPHQQLLTHREYVRCGRLLRWPDLTHHENECVRLCSQLETPWLLPQESELWTQVSEMARHADQVLKGGQPDLDPGPLLARSPVWAQYWRTLQGQAERRQSELLSLRESQSRPSLSIEWLERLEASPLLRQGLPVEPICADLQRAEQQLLMARLAPFEGLTEKGLEELPNGFVGLRVECSGAAPAELSFHQNHLLAQVLRELLSNASRFANQAELRWLDEPAEFGWDLSNPLEKAGSAGSGQGLDYVRYRLKELDGRLELSEENGVFLVRVRCPRPGRRH